MILEGSGMLHLWHAKVSTLARLFSILPNSGVQSVAIFGVQSEHQESSTNQVQVMLLGAMLSVLIAYLAIHPNFCHLVAINRSLEHGTRMRLLVLKRRVSWS